MKVDGLHKSLDQIPATEKAMLLMKYQDNFSIKEIAKTFNISESVTKLRISRKNKKLYLEHLALFSLIALKILLPLKK
jgi:DNA-directed RNA polymerase specialized sigma24 family protein